MQKYSKGLNGKSNQPPQTRQHTNTKFKLTEHIFWNTMHNNTLTVSTSLFPKRECTTPSCKVQSGKLHICVSLVIWWVGLNTHTHHDGNLLCVCVCVCVCVCACACACKCMCMCMCMCACVWLTNSYWRTQLVSECSAVPQVSVLLYRVFSEWE